MTKTTLNAVDCMHAEEEDSSITIVTNGKKRTFNLLTNEQCEQLRDEAIKTGRKVVFIKRNGKIYGGIVPKDTHINDDNKHLCAKCRLICDKTLAGANAWEFPFIKKAVETAGKDSEMIMHTQFIVLNCTDFVEMKKREKMPSTKMSEKVELMKVLYDDLHCSKSTAYSRKKGRI